jgi:hypothetical protein
MSATAAPPVSEAAKHAARQGSEAARMALAGERDAAPEILYFLATDQAARVRAAVAANAATPQQADRLLATDADAAVRAELGRKLAPRAPRLAGAVDRRQQLGWETLNALVADAAIAVRRAIAEELKALPDAPRALILRLARDVAMEVAEPVIRHSPQLTEADLLALIADPPAPATLTAIARRPALSESLSDAIISTGAVAPVAALLENRSAAIREAALDQVILGAARHLAWQAPPVHRPVLPPGAARRLAGFVADHLLEALAARLDLDAAVTQALRERVERRLEVAPPEGRQTLEAVFENAGLQGALPVMAEALAKAAGVVEAMVGRAVRLRSAKGLVSLCWKAGFAPRTATLAQTVLGQINPTTALAPRPGGEWPLSESEMEWQLELLTEPE